MTVRGLAEFERRWGAIPAKVRKEVQEAMERLADEIVADMDKAKPLDEIIVGWTWGQPPKGSIKIGDFGNAAGGGRRMRITLYAYGKNFATHWFEHGTDDRFHKSGKHTGRIQAQPFFYPIWRVWRRRVKGRITRAISKALKSA